MRHISLRLDDGDAEFVDRLSESNKQSPTNIYRDFIKEGISKYKGGATLTEAFRRIKVMDARVGSLETGYGDISYRLAKAEGALEVKGVKSNG